MAIFKAKSPFHFHYNKYTKNKDDFQRFYKNKWIDAKKLLHIKKPVLRMIINAQKMQVDCAGIKKKHRNGGWE